MSRKQSLVDHGFRLPSAVNHRPVNFDELSVKLGWKTPKQVDVHASLTESIKEHAKTLYVSATPAQFELDQSRRIVQQVIRPTGLLDPVTYVYPKSGNYDALLTSVERLVEKKPDVGKYLSQYGGEVAHDLF